MPAPAQTMAFLLVLLRCLSFYALGPLFGSRRIPNQVKLILALVTAAALFPTVDPSDWRHETTLFGFLLLVVREVLLGALLSFVVSIVFAGIKMAGELAGLQMGLNISAVVDPGSGESSLLGVIQEMLAAFLFVLMDGHYLLLRALGASLREVPPGGFPALEQLPALVVPLATGVLLITLQVGAPLVAALFLTDAALGLVARAVPQINVLVVGVQLKVAVGIFLLLLSAPLLARLLETYIGQMEGQISTLLHAI